jgi:hypothetical protein
MNAKMIAHSEWKGLTIFEGIYRIVDPDGEPEP